MVSLTKIVRGPISTELWNHSVFPRMAAEGTEEGNQRPSLPFKDEQMAVAVADLFVQGRTVEGIPT